MATLHRLTVRGFKAIRSLEEIEVRGVNVLIGANGAGKSNLLDVFPDGGPRAAPCRPESVFGPSACAHVSGRSREQTADPA